MISTHTSTNAANGIMTNHSMSVFLEIVNETIRNAVNLEDAAGDYYSSNAGSSDEDRVCFGVRLRQPTKQGCVDHSQKAERDFQPSDFFLDSVNSRHVTVPVAYLPSILMD